MASARAIGSLPVANVQDLAETCFNKASQVPERYLVEADPEEVVVVISGDDSISAIPVIDFSKLCDPLSSSEECVRLVSACHDWGFFQVCNHAFLLQLVLFLLPCLHIYRYAHVLWRLQKLY
jgi:hypothetical protein